jgi:hypothetical protein
MPKTCPSGLVEVPPRKEVGPAGDDSVASTVREADACPKRAGMSVARKRAAAKSRKQREIELNSMKPSSKNPVK